VRPMSAASTSEVVAKPVPPPVLVSCAAASVGDPEEENQEPPSSAERRFEPSDASYSKKEHSKKNAWTAEEDATLARVIAEFGHGHWTKVAAWLPGRMGRQCRERWFNHLAPEVKKGDWSKEEDQLIVAAVREHGTKWSLIQKLLVGRSDNSIKNRYYSAIRKAQRLEKRSVAGPASLSVMSDTDLEEGQPTPPAGNSPNLKPPPEQTDAAEKGMVMRHTQSGASPQGSPTTGKRKQRPQSVDTPHGSSAGLDGGPSSPANHGMGIVEASAVVAGPDMGDNLREPVLAEAEVASMVGVTLAVAEVATIDPPEEIQPILDHTEHSEHAEHGSTMIQTVASATYAPQ